MNIDWWSLMREMRVEAWKNVGTILSGLLEQFWKMLTSGDPLQAILVVALFAVLIYTSGRAVLKLIGKLTRNGVLDF
jgi:hypothetical protein